MWPFLVSVTYFSKCGSFYQLWPIFPNVTHYSKFFPFLQMWPIFTCVTHLSKCYPFYQVWSMFFKCYLFYQVWPISLNITHFHKSNPFDQIEPILLTVTHFSKCDPRLIKCAQFRLKCLTCHEDNTACSTKLSPVRRGYFLAGWRYSKSPCSSYFIFFVMFEVSFWICRHFFYITSAIFLAIAGPS